MRDESNLSFYYSEEFENEIWKDCIFVLDTSALLELYFYSNASQQKIFDNILRPLKARLWIPSHVEFEYLKNRKSAIKKPIAEKYSPIREIVDDIRSDVKSLKLKINDLRQKTQKSETHPYFDQGIFDKVIEAVESSDKEFNSFFNGALAQIDLRKNEIEALEKNDAVLFGLTDLLSVGREYSFKKKLEILAESEIRFRNRIPPGYKDAEGKDQKDGLQRIGDLIIWRQIIDYASVSKKPVVFVTNDVKEDWCYATKRSNEVRIERPKEDLIQEIHAEADVKFWMYNFPQFLYACKKMLGVSIDANVIEEAEDVARERFPTSSKLRFDGFYFYFSARSKNFNYMRFFADNTLIRIVRTREIKSEELKSFNENYAKNRGTYILNGELIAFSTISEKGTVDYSGIINDDSMTLSWYSYINGNKSSGTVYNFIQFEEALSESPSSPYVIQ
jgi:hypothetical protein